MKKNTLPKYLIDEMLHHDREAEHYSERVETDYIWEVPAEMFLFKKIAFEKNMNVIDFGCGTSTIIKHVIPKNILEKINYYGVDISKEMLRIAKANIPSGKFIQADMETAKFDKEFADVIISLGALHHSDDKIHTLKNWLSILKKDGVLLLREPTYAAFKRGEGDSPHEEGVQVESIREYLQKANMEIVSLSYFTSPAFHLFNRILIKLGLGKWQKNRIFWYPVILFDVCIDKLAGMHVPFFRGLAFTMIIKKT